MSYYVAVVHQNDDDNYFLYFPDIEGLTVTSNNMVSLLKDATETLSVYFETNEATIPRTLSDISSDKEVKNHFRNGATLNLIPNRENKK